MLKPVLIFDYTKSAKTKKAADKKTSSRPAAAAASKAQRPTPQR